ncbi:MAG: SPFH domain-containing protein [Planctomycetota bacterium]|nr:SPFH domain-containing protein [Planctomycetota bacterium]
MPHPQQVQISKKAVIGVIVLVVLVGLGFLFFSTIRAVDTESVAVITVFGEVTDVEEQEGLHFFQHPFSQFHIMPVSLQLFDLQMSAFSAENQDVSCKLNVAYRLNRAQAMEVYRQLREDPRMWTSFISPIAENAFKELTIEYKITDIVAKREELRKKAVEIISNRLMEQGGQFTIERVEIVDMDYSDQYKQQIEERNKMTQQALRAEEQLKKERTIAQIPIIQAEAKVEAARSEAEARIIEAEAQAKAFDILSKNLTNMLLILEAIRKWNGILPFGSDDQKEEETGEDAMFN